MRATSISTSVKIGLRFIGFWPGLPYGNFSCFAYMTSLVITLYFQYMYIFGHFDVSNVLTLIDALSITLSYSLFFLKMISFWSNRRIFFDILLAMDEDWSNAAAVGRDRSMLCIMTENAILSRRCSNMLISIFVIASTSYAMTELIRKSGYFKEDVNISSRELPFKMEFPFKVDASPLFELVAIGQCLHEVSVATLAAMMNSLVVTLVLHVSGQIDILRRELSTIYYDDSRSRDSIVAGIRLLIARHQRIITLSDNIDLLYSNIALMQFMLNTIVICCIGFTIIGTIGNKQEAVILTKSILFYVAITLEAFVFCFAGEYLSAKSKSIGDAAYESHWYEMTSAESRFLSFVILRSQKRLTITAGNVMDLSLEGFTSVMKASASYMSVLHAMY